MARIRYFPALRYFLTLLAYIQPKRRHKLDKHRKREMQR